MALRPGTAAYPQRAKRRAFLEPKCCKLAAVMFVDILQHVRARHAKSLYEVARVTEAMRNYLTGEGLVL